VVKYHGLGCRYLSLLGLMMRPQLNGGTLADESLRALGHPSVAPGSVVCILRRMPRMQVYLPDDLYKLVKKSRLPASELLQDAVRAEVRRRELLREADRYIVDLTAEVGEPSTRQRARAAAIVQRVVARRPRKTG
jgi:hypothetical protein